MEKLLASELGQLADDLNSEHHPKAIQLACLRVLVCDHLHDLRDRTGMGTQPLIDIQRSMMQTWLEKAGPPWREVAKAYDTIGRAGETARVLTAASQLVVVAF